MSAAGMRLFDEQTIDGVQVMSDYGVSFETFSLVQETSARLSAENDALRARVAKLEAWAKEWHNVAETICLLAGVSQGLGADEMVIAFRDNNDALRARVAHLEAALELFACDCKVNCPEPECDNWEVRAVLKDAPQ